LQLINLTARAPRYIRISPYNVFSTMSLFFIIVPRGVVMITSTTENS